MFEYKYIDLERDMHISNIDNLVNVVEKLTDNHSYKIPHREGYHLAGFNVNKPFVRFSSKDMINETKKHVS